MRAAERGFDGNAPTTGSRQGTTAAIETAASVGIRSVIAPYAFSEAQACCAVILSSPYIAEIFSSKITERFNCPTEGFTDSKIL